MKGNENTAEVAKKPDKVKIKTFKEYSFKAEQNSRQSMEDFIKIIPKFSGQESKAYFSIFDGHSGVEAASYCQQNFHRVFASFLYKTNLNLEKSINLSFQQINTDLLTNSSNNEAGTTATILFIFKQFNSLLNKSQRILSCSNVGDSKAFLVTKQKQIIQITTEHKCSESSEVQRVKSAGGIVFSGRVYGRLMLTRTIGDKEMKKYGVIATPSIYKKIIDENDWFVIAASDGVWDAVNEDNFKAILDGLSESASSEEIINIFFDKAFSGGIGDNISIIVVLL